MIDLGIKNVWLTLNRQCNLRCYWCYASSLGYLKNDDLPIDDAYMVIDMAYELGIHGVTLIGGEPTCYPYLIEVVSRCKQKGLISHLVTNGVKLSDKDYTHQLKEAGLNHVGLSMKGWDKQSYIDRTKNDEFNQVIKGIENLSHEEIDFSVSFVITKDSINDYIKAIIAAKKAGAYRFGFMFAYDFSNLYKGCKPGKYNFQEEIFNFTDSFEKKYDELCNLTDNKMVLMSVFPLCVWSKDFIQKVKNNGHLESICQVLRHTGLVLDTNLNVIPCNGMHNVYLGKYGDDFTDAASFSNFWARNDVSLFFKRIRNLPSGECNSCDLLDVCGGGCQSNWFNFSYNDLKKALNERNKKCS